MPELVPVASASLDPVLETVQPADSAAPSPGMALCLSGGGSRAMLFHAGALLRLNELRLLGRLDRISTVSGGSIVGGLLARRWTELAFADGRSDGLEALIIKPLRELARHRIDVPTWLLGTLLPGTTPALRFADVLDQYLYDGWTLDRLPDAPRFVINATNIGTGTLFRFSKPYLADYQLGMVEQPTTGLAIAVAASAAFPPFFSPLRLDLGGAAWTDVTGMLPDEALRAALRAKPALGDGGMYDNLGLETAWRAEMTVLVSDGGGALSIDPSPPGDLLRQSMRVTQVIDRQVRALRKRLLIAGYREQVRQGAYFGIRSAVADFPKPTPLPCPPALTQALAALPTRMTRMPERTQERLINWGYAIADVGLRSHVAQVSDAPPPTAFPYPKAGLG